MGFFESSFRARLPVRTRAPIFAVGRRVYVASSGDRATRLTLTDDAGSDAPTSLADGTEVEILAWRPRSSGTHYRVRSTRSGLEGWLAAGSLRGVHPAVSSLPNGPTPPAGSAARLRARQAGASTRRLGKRSV